jgi:hypothetical protein
MDDPHISLQKAFRIINQAIAESLFRYVIKVEYTYHSGGRNKGVIWSRNPSKDVKLDLYDRINGF